MIDADYASVTLLLHANGTNGSTTIVDDSFSPKTFTANGNVQISTTQSKFGGSSFYFDGTGDYLSTPASSDFDFGSGNFTIEGFFYTNGATSGVIYSNYDDANPNGGGISISVNTNKIVLFTSGWVNYTNTSINGTLTANQWNHFAMVRNGNVCKIYVNGVADTLTADANPAVNNAARNLLIGVGKYSSSLLNHFTGYVDEIRVTKGVARYTANFTPPSQEFLDFDTVPNIGAVSAQTTGCTVTPRTVITDSVFVSSTVAETDHAVWSSVTTYGIGDKRIKNHRIYESLRVSNLNFDPVTDTSSPPYWLDTGPTNRWGMLDDSVSTLTTSSGSTMTIVLSPGRMDTLGLLDVDASEVRVQLSTIADGTFYDVTHSMTTRDTLTNSWYNYFYGGFVNKTTLVLLGLPKAGSVTLTLTFAKSAGTVSCGLVTFGLASVIGKVQYGAKIGIIDYSRKETDAFGRTTLVQRTFAKTMDVALYLNRSQVDAVSRKLAEVRSTACLWVAANNDYDSLSVYGFFRDWSIGIEYFDGSTCNLTIEGLT